jgi:hypothetical protein
MRRNALCPRIYTFKSSSKSFRSPEVHGDEFFTCSYYFPDEKFLSALKKSMDIPALSHTIEIRYLPSSCLRRFLWRSLEYNETFAGSLYRLIYGSICIYSIFLFMSDIIFARNEHFLQFHEQYRSFTTNASRLLNITVQSIDYRPDITRVSFSIEILFILLWVIESFLRLMSAPSVYLCISSTFFW